MDQIIKVALQSHPHEAEWLDRYLQFLEETVEPTEDDYQETHHILPVSLFPQFRSLRENPWNCVDLKGSDHLIAHYFLLKALPHVHPLRQAFCLMAGLMLEDDLEVSPDLLQKMAEEYTFQKTGLRWMSRNGEELKVLPHEHESYLADGWVFGRGIRHDVETVQAIKRGCSNWHKHEAAKPNAYQYLPHGDQHHRRIFGCPPEVRAKISASLEGQKADPAAVEKRRAKMVGKRWSWSEESRKAQSERMRGPLNARYGKPSSMKGRQHREGSKQKISQSLTKFYQENPEARFKKVRGEQHHFYGKKRSEEDRARISATMTGRVQSVETCKKRSHTLRKKLLPQFTPEEEAVFKQFCSAPPEQREAIRKLIPSSNRSAYALLYGLNIILQGATEEYASRYWRMAAIWLEENSKY